MTTLTRMERVWVTSNVYAEFTYIDEETTDYKLILDHIGPYEVNMLLYHRNIHYGIEKAIEYREKTTTLTEMDINVNGSTFTRTDDIDVWYNDNVENWDPRCIDCYVVFNRKGSTPKRYYLCHANDGDCIFFEEECANHVVRKLRCWHDEKGRLVKKDIVTAN